MGQDKETSGTTGAPVEVNAIVMNFTSIETPNEEHKPDMCGCSVCGWKGKCSDCETEMESEGWEYPDYEVHICPKCEDGGCIDDYWHS